MAVVMLLMLSQGFSSSNNLMIVMMGVMAIVAMGFLMKINSNR